MKWTTNIIVGFKIDMRVLFLAYLKRLESIEKYKYEKQKSYL